jgi:hypothetical protein
VRERERERVSEREREHLRFRCLQLWVERRLLPSPLSLLHFALLLPWHCPLVAALLVLNSALLAAVLGLLLVLALSVTPRVTKTLMKVINK